MTDTSGPVPKLTRLSRRRLAALSLAGAMAGAVWTTGLTILARGRHPQVFVLGGEHWQVLLLEHGTNRIAMLLGKMDRSPEPEIDLLCGLLRQHIDVVIGTGQSLGLLSTDFRERRSVATIVQLDASSMTTASAGFVPLSNPIELSAGELTLLLTPLWNGLWISNAPEDVGWVGCVTIGDVKIAIGPTLDTIADHGDIRAALGIAPVGDIARLWRTAPGIAIATNTRESFASLGLNSPRSRLTLVRTFPRDIAAFVVRGGRIHLPNWTQSALVVGRDA